jgi:tetratricopeptide (TPR) repeat protein
MLGPAHGFLERLRRMADPASRRPRRRLDASSGESCEARLDQAYAAYERGDFERAHDILNSSCTVRQRRFLRGINRYVSYVAWTEARRGHSREAVAALNDWVSAYGIRDDIPRDYVVTYRFQGLAPLDPEIRTWIRRGDEFVQCRRWAPTVTADFLGHKGYVLARTGSTREAETVLRRACEIDGVDFILPRMRARLMADFADVLRILGERDEATSWLDRAEEIHANHDYLGERADHVLNCRAKLEPDRERAVALLELAAGVQRRLKNRVALVRTLLLQARLSTDRAVAERLRRRIVKLRGHVPDLENCPRLAQILSRWSEWACGAGGAENGDFFWLV